MALSRVQYDGLITNKNKNVAEKHIVSKTKCLPQNIAKFATKLGIYV